MNFHKYKNFITPLILLFVSIYPVLRVFSWDRALVALMGLFFLVILRSCTYVSNVKRLVSYVALTYILVKLSIHEFQIKLIFIGIDLFLAWIIIWVFSLVCILKDESYKNIKSVLFILYILSALFFIKLSYDVGFYKLYSHFDHLNPERLRDITFYIWDKNPVKTHYFISFLSLDEFQHSKAYGGMTPIYLTLMYGFNYVLETLLRVSIRNIAAIQMMLISVSVIYIYIDNLDLKRVFRLWDLVPGVAALGFLITSPQFWITAGKHNVDNTYFMALPCIILSSYLAQLEVISFQRKFILWVSLSILSLISPITGVLLALYWLVFTFSNSSRVIRSRLLKYAVFLITLGVSITLYAPTIIHYLGYKTESSTWLFRSGLDGGTYFFTGIFQAILAPQYPRQWYLLLPPILVSLMIILFSKFYTVSESIENKGNSDGYTTRWPLIYGAIYSYYLGFVLLWPQSVSVHPYLYDFGLLMPLYFFVFQKMSMGNFKKGCNPIILYALFIGIQMNLLAIAQSAGCPQCYPDLPTICGNAMESKIVFEAGACHFL